MSKVTDPNAKGGNGFIWGVGVLLVIIAVVIGYIVWNGKQSDSNRVGDVNREATEMGISYSEGVITLKSSHPVDNAAEVDLYEDYSCSHCAELAEKTDERMKQEIESGRLIVNIHTLNFLDLGNQKMEDYLRDESIMLDSHSTKSAGVVKAIAEQGDVETYWALRKYLMQNQSNVYEKWEIGDFADAAKRLGADSSVVKAVEQVSKEDGNGIGRSNDKTLKEQTGTVSSPRVLQDGKDISQENIFEWVDVALK